MKATAELADAVDRELPQTQCTRCGFADCRAYAEAIADAAAPIDRCPPGGAEGIARLARATGLPVVPLDVACGVEGPRGLAVIDEAWCIGCTLCLKVCPVDCIVGAAKSMHTVVAEQCTGCELCIPACPVDCISLQPVSGAATGWAAWSRAQADEARARHAFHQERLARRTHERDARLAGATPGAAPVEGSDAVSTATLARSQTIADVLARARAARGR